MKPSPPNSIPSAIPLSIHADRAAMGKAAALHVVDTLSALLKEPSRGSAHARVIFACAPSQDEFLHALVEAAQDRIDWSKVTAFHMDEYVGLPASHPASFRTYLHHHLLSHINGVAFHPIQGEAQHPDLECLRYAALVDAEPIDLICLGIGENGHLAFNDPPVADFSDPATAKVVELDAACRAQQVHDGCFPEIDAVPARAITLTLPVFQRARHLSVVVPGARKADALLAACCGPISTACPASLLQTHPNVMLFTDKPGAGRLPHKAGA